MIDFIINAAFRFVNTKFFLLPRIPCGKSASKTENVSKNNALSARKDGAAFPSNHHYRPRSIFSTTPLKKAPPYMRRGNICRKISRTSSTAVFRLYRTVMPNFLSIFFFLHAFKISDRKNKGYRHCDQIGGGCGVQDPLDPEKDRENDDQRNKANDIADH